MSVRTHFNKNKIVEFISEHTQPLVSSCKQFKNNEQRDWKYVNFIVDKNVFELRRLGKSNKDSIATRMAALSDCSNKKIRTCETWGWI